MIREKAKIKTVVGATQFSLQAEAGQSIRIRDIMVYSPSDEYATIYVNNAVVGYFRVGGGTLGNHLAFPGTDVERMTIYKLLNELGIFSPIPLASGQTMKIVGVHDSDSVVTVIYDLYDASDVQNTEKNGSHAKTFGYINYGRYSTTLASGDNLYSTQQTTNQFPAFPFGAVVPAKHKAKMFGILASDFGRASSSASNKQSTNYLKLIRNRVTLFDDDRNGIPIIAAAPSSDGTNIGIGQGIIGNYDSIDLRRPYLFETPLEFTEGESLDVYVNTSIAAGSANIAAKDAEIAFILEVSMI